jgi:hypothetical protein
MLFSANSVSKVLCFIPFKLMTTSYVGFHLLYSPLHRPIAGAVEWCTQSPTPGVRGWGQLYSFREIEWEKGGGSEGWRREKGAGDWKRWFGENDIEVFKEFISDFFFCMYEGLNMATDTQSWIHCHTFAVTIPHQYPNISALFDIHQLFLTQSRYW